VVAHRCFALPRSSILCGCINFPGKQVNAVWGRYPTACAMYAKKSLECIGGSSTKSLPPSSLETWVCRQSCSGHSSCGSSYPWVYLYTLRIAQSGAGASARLVATEATHSPSKGVIAGIGKRRCAEALQTLPPGSPLPIIAAYTYTYLLRGLKCPGYIYTPFALCRGPALMAGPGNNPVQGFRT
jgi:hypothetical protein